MGCIALASFAHTPSPLPRQTPRLIELDFCHFFSVIMVSCSKQKRATLVELGSHHSTLIPEQGGSRGYYSTAHPAKDSQRNSTPTQTATPGASPSEAPTRNAQAES